MRAIGVTGTNGKSTTTTLIAAALAHAGRRVLRVTTLGIDLVDRDVATPIEHEDSWPGFLSAVDEARRLGAERAAIETTSEALASGFAQRFPLEIGVFTNLTRDHLDAHGSAEHYLASKAQLFVALPAGGTAVLNAADPASRLLAEIVPAHARRSAYAVASRGPALFDADAIADLPVSSLEGTHARVRRADGTAHSLRTRAIGAHFLENALAALLAVEAFGLSRDEAIDAIGAAPPPRGRFEVVAHAPAVVVDYAHTPDAMRRTIATARALADGGRVWVVFGAGGDRDRGKRPAMGSAAAGADHVVLTSDNPRSEDPAEIAAQIASGITGDARVEVVLDRAAAIERALDLAGRRDVVVVAGKGHEGTQERDGERRRFSDQEVIADLMRDRR